MAMPTWWSRLRRGVTTLLRGSTSASAGPRLASRSLADWDDYDARMGRYDLFRSMREGTTYEDAIHQWAEQYRIDNSLDPSIQDIANPTQQIVEFWATHTMAGQLDPKAGDGQTTPSALPLLDASDAARTAIATLWRHSRWQQNKTVYCRLGANLGDVGLAVRDDPERGRVTTQVIDPADIADLTLDAVGNVRHYTIERFVPDPRPEAQTPSGAVQWVIYREVVEKVGGGVRYRLFLDDGTPIPYPWGLPASDWTVEYPFVPLVWVNHLKVLTASPYGAPEFQGSLPLLRRLDNLLTKADKGYGRAVDAPWLFAGIQRPTSAVTFDGDERTVGNPNPGMGETPALYGPSEARPWSLVTDFHPEALLKHVQFLMDRIKDNHPELRRVNEWAYGDASGKSLRIARQGIELRAIDRRANYDAGFVQHMQQALAIAGWRGYRGYEPFGFGSYDAGDLDFRIGPRSVFGHDVEDDLERDKMLWDNAAMADTAGVPVTTYLELQGWKPERIAIVERGRKQALADGFGVGRSTPAPGETQQPENKSQPKEGATR